ncbi:DUF2490 domain-containing protein [Cytophaga aurantiaca]|uniref:DUF2490 domain-containing protein n=1 Tax=Cytophaga aurantiaca TaxID=29530 RepID=UPI00037BDF8D|nr:DUF2490 domain-containing protein [Cytophaga aurantiaca]
MLRKGFLILLILIAAAASHAQTKNVYSDNMVWTQYFFRGQLSSRWFLHLDLGYRTRDYVNKESQYFIRPGVLYQISPKVNIQAGYAYFNTNQFLSGYEDVMRPEHRLYQRLTVIQRAGRFEIRNRYRLEERFNQNISKGVLLDGYTPSFRVGYQIYISCPINNTTIKEGTLFAILSDELFVSFGKKVFNNFDQNRFAAGLGYQFTKGFGATLYYQYIYGQQATGTQLYAYNAYCISLSQTIDFRKKELSSPSK